jgi:hypothetical protein
MNQVGHIYHLHVVYNAYRYVAVENKSAVGNAVSAAPGRARLPIGACNKIYRDQEDPNILRGTNTNWLCWD